jgi:carbon-monoxide dehydrogenase medium subunit
MTVKICLGTVAPTPIRAIRAEGVLMGKLFDDSLVKEASEECGPRSSKRASAEYRREMVKVLTQRALNQAKEEAR